MILTLCVVLLLVWMSRLLAQLGPQFIQVSAIVALIVLLLDWLVLHKGGSQ